MTASAQGLYKTISYKKQSGLGTPATGAGGTQLRRETGTFKKTNQTYNSDEIVAHQQYTGDTYGPGSTEGQLVDVLSAGSFAPLFGSLLRKDFAAGASATGMTLAIAGAGPSFTLTRSAGSFLTDGFKIGDVVRITAGTFTGTASTLNLIVTAVTALVLTVIVPNGKTLSAQSGVTGVTIAVVNKKSTVPSTGHTNDYYSIEEWRSDITRSRFYTDQQVASVDVSIPATGNSKVTFNFLGLGRTKSASQQLTSPAAASTTAILSAANAKVLVAAAQTTVATSLNMKIDGQLKTGEPVISSNTISDIVKGDMKVAGTISLLRQDETVSDNFDNQTPVQIVAILFADTTDTSDFVGFNMPRSKVFSDEDDDGKKQIIESHAFTAEYNSAGGAALSSDTGIISIQDSAA